ncbi:MAG: exo-alpha-sialidase [Gemmatimonadetes bacterium]|nr:exo-alpha-sialidase [Gemmatimonadota bacterium]MBT6144476.1 exo-alpha-sialidase [Gemmatimonadota bacterium]MBT7863298.1 exo-alpha-sialidase [Gemmatimonadota bacterium]
MERFIAIDGVCAWPNMTRLDDDELVVAIYNRPVHGRWHGDVEAWGSSDGGRTWAQRGTAAPGEPPGNRMNVAGGRAANGDLVVIASGWTPVLAPGTDDPQFAFQKREVLDARVCRSADGGHSWERVDSVELPDADQRWFIPFGDIVQGDNMLGVSFYSSPPNGGSNTAWFVRSQDDGHTWSDATVIAADDYNETDLLFLGDGCWLAACRTFKDGHLDLFASEDDGRSWVCRGPLSLPRQHPAHLTHLSDGRLLVTYGLRNEGLHGVAARLSPDAGKTWQPPQILVQLDEPTDCGYPSSAQLSDGTIVTAYYSKRTNQHERYHMGVVRWTAADIVA